MKNFVIALAVSASVIAGGAAVGSQIVSAVEAHAETATAQHPWDQSHRPCRGEDSPGPCFWNADSRGNQKGTDFHRDRKGRVYVPGRDVFGHDACWFRYADTTLVWCEDGFRTTS